MHELVIASGIVEAISQYARERKARVQSFTVAIGEIADFNRELVEGLIRDLVDNSDLKGAEVKVVVEKAEVRCYGCNSLWGFRDLIEPLPDDYREMIHFVPELLSSFTKCPNCGSQDLHIESGRSVRIVEVKLH